MNSDFFMRLLIELSLGVGIGFTIGMTGVGAGILVLPVLIYIIDLSPIDAIGTGLLYSMLIRFYAVYEHFKLNTVRKRTAFYIGIGGIPTILITSFAITQLEETFGEDFNLIIEIIMALVMLMTWVFMLRNIIKSYKNVEHIYYEPPKEFPKKRKIYGIITGAVVGILIGATSIGGGVIIIPVLASIFQLSPVNTVGTSNLITIMLSGVGSIIYLLYGRINYVVSIAFSIGSIPGVWFGAKLASKTPHKVLETIIFLVITTSIIAMCVGIKH